MAELTKLRKIDLILLVEKQEKEIEKLKGSKGDNKELLQRIADLEEENKLLAIQQDEDDVVNVSVPVTTPKKSQGKKKLTDMNEFELAEHMRLTTSRKIL